MSDVQIEEHMTAKLSVGVRISSRVCCFDRAGTVILTAAITVIISHSL